MAEQINLCVRRNGENLSFPLTATVVTPALAVRYDGKNWYNELVDPSDSRAGQVRLRHGGKIYALSLDTSGWWLKQNGFSWYSAAYPSIEDFAAELPTMSSQHYWTVTNDQIFFRWNNTDGAIALPKEFADLTYGVDYKFFYPPSDTTDFSFAERYRESSDMGGLIEIPASAICVEDTQIDFRHWISITEAQLNKVLWRNETNNVDNVTIFVYVRDKIPATYDWSKYLVMDSPFESSLADKCGNTWQSVGSTTAADGAQFSGSNYLQLQNSITLGGGDFIISGSFDMNSLPSTGQSATVFTMFNDYDSAAESISLRLTHASNRAGLHYDVFDDNTSGYQVYVDDDMQGFEIQYKHDVGLLYIYEIIAGERNLIEIRKANIPRTTFEHVLVGKSNNSAYENFVGSVRDLKIYDIPAEVTSDLVSETSYVNYTRSVEGHVKDDAPWHWVYDHSGANDFVRLPDEFTTAISYFDKLPIVKVFGNATGEEIPFVPTKNLPGMDIFYYQQLWRYDDYDTLAYVLYINYTEDFLRKTGSTGSGVYDTHGFLTVHWAVKATKYTITAKNYETADSELTALSVDYDAGRLYSYGDSVYIGLLETTCLDNAFGGHLPASLKVYDGNGNLLTRDTDYTIYRRTEDSSTAIIIVPQAKMKKSTLTVEYTTYELVDYNPSYKEGDNNSWIAEFKEGARGVIAPEGYDRSAVVGELTDLPETKSVTGTAFYQTVRARCFALPATDEVWMKFDVYFDGSKRWRAYNGDNNQTLDDCGVSALTNGALSFFIYSQLNQEFSGVCKTNQLQTVLLHMVSGSLVGIIEAWVDGTKIYTYTGDVNHGQDFADLYLQSDGSGTFFSDVTISPKPIGTKPADATDRMAEPEPWKAWLRFDNSVTVDKFGNTWTAYGSPTIQDGALYLPGSSSYIAKGSGVALGGRDFTISCCFNMSSSAGYWCRIFQLFNTSNAETDAIRVARREASTTLDFAIFNTVFQCTATLNTIHHVELDYIHSSGQTKVFLDGVLKGTVSKSVSRTTFANCWLGRSNFSADGYYVGTIDEFIIYDGVALHTENFTPPTDDDYAQLAEEWGV